MRFHYWQWLLNQEGQPVPNADIYVYSAGTSTAIYLYLSESGSEGTSASPQITTDNNGFFEFWIGDTSDTYGYSLNTKIDITWSKPGVITEDTIEDVDVTFQAEEVDETDNASTSKNKLVSNSLAYDWNSRAKVYSETVSASSWIADGTGPSGTTYRYDLVHSLNNNAPVVVCINSVDPKYSVTITLESLGESAVRIWKDGNDDVYVTAIG